MNNFSNEVREMAYEIHNGYCCVKGCFKPINDFHHALHNTETNNKKYPLFVQSIFNCKSCCRDHHEHYSEFIELNISNNEAKYYEKYLQSLLTKGVE